MLYLGLPDGQSEVVPCSCVNTITKKLLSVNIHSFARGSVVLERSLVVSHTGGFLIYVFRKLVGLFWTSDQHFSMVSSYTEQYNAERREQALMP
jgi:hypothetical protein